MIGRRSWLGLGGCRSFVLAVVCASAGCMVGPDFKQPPTKVADHWIEAGTDSVEVTHPNYRDWWSALNDPVLTQLIDGAYQQNLTLLAAGVRVLRARAQLGAAIGEFYPQQQEVTAEANYNRIPFSIPFNVISHNYWQVAFGAQAGWELDLWGKIRRGVESADEAYLASVADYDDVLVSLTGDVASTYVKIRTTEAQVVIAQQNIERQKEALTIAWARFNGGVVTKRDVYQAENVLGSTEAAIPQLDIELQSSKDALAVLLGEPPGTLNELLSTSTGIPVTPEKVAVGIPADLLRRRPDVRKAELQAAAQCAQIGMTKGDLLPAFSLVGNLGTFATNVGDQNLGKLFSADSFAYSAGPAVQWNILNYGQITNNVRVQDAKFQEMIAAYQQAVLEAQKDVENGVAEFVESRQEVVFLKKSVEAAKGALTIALLQYKEGTVDFTTVLNAEKDLFQAQNSLAIAEGNVPQGLIKVYRALGGGWEIRQGQDFVPAATREEMAERTDWGTTLTPDLIQPQAPGLPAPDDEGSLVRPPEW